MRRADGSVALADFGIAKSHAAGREAGPVTQTAPRRRGGHAVLPEPRAGVRAATITPQSDLYSLGVMMFEMLTGERPFQAESLDVLLARHLHAPTPRLPDEHARAAAHRWTG